MSLETGFRWTFEDIELVGYSLAGISTSLAFPRADVCFDVAQGLPFHISINNILITHGHLDHAAGLPYVLGQKTMRSLKPAQVYMPEALVAPMRQILDLWSGVEDHTYKYELHANAPEKEIPLKGKLFARAFPTYHRVPSNGYTVFERKKRLRAEYRGRDREALGDLRRQGLPIEENYEEALISFTGDTKIEFLNDPVVVTSRVLVMEVTYWDEKKPIASAREWGHIHLEELLASLDRIKSEKILLIHTSARYSPRQLQEILQRRVPEKHQGRVEIFPRN